MLDIMGHLCFGAAFGFISGKGDALMGSFHKRAVRIYMVCALTYHSPKPRLSLMRKADCA